MGVVGWKCSDCDRAVHQIVEKAIAAPRDEAWQPVWAVVGTEDWVCPETGDEHRAVVGEGTYPYEVEFTIIEHVWAKDEKTAYEKAERAAQRAAVDGAFSNYDDAVRRITPDEM